MVIVASRHCVVQTWTRFPQYWPLCAGNAPVIDGLPTQSACNAEPLCFFVFNQSQFLSNNQISSDLRCRDDHVT